MTLEMRNPNLSPRTVVRGPLFPEPVEVITSTPMGESVKLVAKGLKTGRVHDPILSADQLAQLTVSPTTEPFDGDPLLSDPAGRSAGADSNLDDVPVDAAALAPWQVGEFVSEVLLEGPERAGFLWPPSRARHCFSVAPIVDIVPACRKVSTRPDQAHHVGSGPERGLRLAW